MIAKRELQENVEMSKIEIPEFKSYEEEAAFWDNWILAISWKMMASGFTSTLPMSGLSAFRYFQTQLRASHERARAQGVSTETLVNAWLIEHMHEVAATA